MKKRLLLALSSLASRSCMWPLTVTEKWARMTLCFWHVCASQFIFRSFEDSQLATTLEGFRGLSRLHVAEDLVHFHAKLRLKLRLCESSLDCGHGRLIRGEFRCIALCSGLAVIYKVGMSDPSDSGTKYEAGPINLGLKKLGYLNLIPKFWFEKI